MSFPGPYRPVKVEYDSENSWDSNQDTQGVNLTTNDMDVNQVQALIESALAQKDGRFQAQLNTMNKHLQRISIEVPQVITYERITANPAIACDLSLDIIKSVPKFSGTQEEYVSRRQTATDSYEIFRPYNGSNAHYKAMTIIRNKIKGSARALLFSHNTVLNFDAIIAMLDCTYAERTSLRMLGQALDMVRQGDLS